MPMYDWTRVDAGIYHAFHHSWISEIGRALNRGLLPADYYALAEQQAAGFGPDVLTLQDRPATMMVETPAEFYRRKKSTVVVRHVSGDRIVAMVEIVSPGNKSSAHAVKAFVEKACELLHRKIHLLLIDPSPPGKRDPHGLHAAIWEELEDDVVRPPPDRPLTLVAYECDLRTPGYIEPLAVGDPLPDMPLFLEPEVYVDVPLEATYMAAWEAVPARWRRVIDPPPHAGPAE
jgi:hypothetical protein